MYKPLLFLLLFLFVITGCRTTTVEGDDSEGKIYINYTDWAESVALTHLAELLLEERLEYEVITKLTNVDTAFMEVAMGEADVFADAWVPSTHAAFMLLYKDDLEDLGPNYRNARTGFVVPDYMEEGSIADIIGSYNSPIVGIDSTAGIMVSALRAIESYGLVNELLILSDEEMSERVEDAIKRREPVVFTGWEPHWLFFRYELKYLADPLGIYPENENIHTVARSGFIEGHPRAAKFFERMILSENQINELLYEVLLSRDPKQGARVWIEKNEFTVNQWVRGLRPEREKIM